MREFFSIFSYCLYIVVLIGLYFHTTHNPISSNPLILGKYSIRYLILLLILTLLFIPYVKFVQFTFKNSTFRFKRKAVSIPPYRKLIIYVLFILIALTPFEIYLRTHPKRDIGYAQENYHPFLQNKLTPTMGDSYHVNEFGFRAGKMTMEVPSNTFRIFLIGGSTVLNPRVPFDEQVSETLRKELQKQFPEKNIEVINAGNEWYTVEHSLIDYLYNISDFKPNLVIMWHGVNDMARSCVPSEFAYGNTYQRDYSHYYGSETQIIESYYRQKPPIEFNLFTINFILKRMDNYLYSDIREWLISWNLEHYGTRLNLPQVNMQFQSSREYKRNLIDFVKVMQLDNIPLILGDQPYLYSNELDKDNKIFWYLQKSCSDGKTQPSLNSLIKGINRFNIITKEVANEYYIPFVEMEKNIPKSTDYFIDDFHLKAKGNTVTAQMLDKVILENNFIE